MNAVNYQYNRVYMLVSHQWVLCNIVGMLGMVGVFLSQVGVFLCSLEQK